VHILFIKSYLLMAINLILVPTTFHWVHASDKLFFAFVFYIAIIKVYVCYAVAYGCSCSNISMPSLVRKKLVHKCSIYNQSPMILDFVDPYFTMVQKD